MTHFTNSYALQKLVILLTSSYAISLDCPSLIQFGDNLGMQLAQPAIWTVLQGDCCTAIGVTCAIQRVTEIRWSSKGLDGYMNGSAIPSSVTLLSLYNNRIKGKIPSALPAGLLYMWLYGNQMSGELPVLPSTLQYLALGYSGYPGNHFSGSLRLNRPAYLYINDNWISNLVIEDSSQINPSLCDLSNNPLLGNPNIAGLTMCIKNGLYNASLLPVTMSTVKLSSTIWVVTSLITETEMNIAVLTAIGSTDFNLGKTTVSIGLRITTLGLSTAIGAFQFEPIMRILTISLFMIMRIVISMLVLVFVIRKTPFTRELKRKIKKLIAKTITRELDFKL